MNTIHAIVNELTAITGNTYLFDIDGDIYQYDKVADMCLNALILEYFPADRIRQIIDAGHNLFQVPWKFDSKHVTGNVLNYTLQNPERKTIIKMMVDDGYDFNNVNIVDLCLMRLNIDFDCIIDILDTLIDNGMDIFSDIQNAYTKLRVVDYISLFSKMSDERNLMITLHLVKRGAKYPECGMIAMDRGFVVFPQYHMRLMHAIRLRKHPYYQIHRELKHNIVNRFSKHIFPCEVVERIAMLI